MMGKVVMLVGVSSAGKTSVAEELQPLLTERSCVGLDDFFSMFPRHW